MRTTLVMIMALSGFLNNSFPQSCAGWDKLEWLLGEWIGEGSGQPGQGGGSFTFTYDLDKKVLVRKSHSEYPAAENRLAIVHDDLMILYSDFSGQPSKAIYFDNEGHTINYSINCSEGSIVFISDKIPGIPVFRLTYSLLENGMLNTKFEMAQDGETFATYIEGISKKTE